MTALSHLAEHLASAQSYEDLSSLAGSLDTVPRSAMFEPLWAQSLQGPWDGTQAMASFLLVKIDPVPPRSCKCLLAEVADSAWNLSNRIVPFYLVSQFGKANVLSCLRKILAAEPERRARVLLEGVEYWAKMPAEALIEPLHYFEWQEVIERDA